MTGVLRFDDGLSASERLRLDWGESLRQHMNARGISRKQLVDAMRELDEPVEVSVQAVGQWLRGETSPRPHHQRAVANVLKAPVHRIFFIERVAS